MTETTNLIFPIDEKEYLRFTLDALREYGVIVHNYCQKVLVISPERQQIYCVAHVTYDGITGFVLFLLHTGDSSACPKSFFNGYEMENWCDRDKLYRFWKQNTEIGIKQFALKHFVEYIIYHYRFDRYVCDVCNRQSINYRSDKHMYICERCELHTDDTWNLCEDCYYEVGFDSKHKVDILSNDPISLILDIDKIMVDIDALNLDSDKRECLKEFCRRA